MSEPKIADLAVYTNGLSAWIKFGDPWVHVALTRKKRRASLFVDGEEVFVYVSPRWYRRLWLRIRRASSVSVLEREDR